MSNSTGNGHPILGVVLGIFGILAALLLTLTTGIVGGGIAIILGLIAVLLGLKARKLGGKGIGAIIVGAIAVILAISMTVSSISAMKAMKTEAAEKNLEIAKYIDKPYLGLMGVIMSLPKDEATLNELVEQLNSLSETETNN